VEAFNHPSSSNVPAIPNADRLGLSEKDHSFLFKHLPEVSAQAAFLRQPGSKDPLEWANGPQPPEQLRAELVEQHKASMLACMMDLRNSNSDDLAFENRKRIVSAFSPPGKRQDTGRPEVQGEKSFFSRKNHTNLG
jgi:small subunit ribosomal protein S15